MSSAAVNSVRLKRTTGATFVGERAGGSVNHSGKVKPFVLPQLNVAVTYCLPFFSVWPRDPGPLRPGIELSDTADDYLRSADRASSG